MTTKEKRFGSKVYFPQNEPKGKRIFIDMNPKCDGLNYADCAVRWWKDEIMDYLNLMLKKPFLGFFGGTKEIVILGPEPLMQIDLVISLIRAMRKQGFRKRITVETGGDVERFNKLWLHGSICQTYQNGILIDMHTTHQAHSEGIAKELKYAGLNKIRVIIDKTKQNDDYHTWEANLFVKKCMVAGLDTYVDLIGYSLQPGETKKEFVRDRFSEWIWITGKSYRLPVSHLRMIEPTSVSPTQQSMHDTP